MGQPMILALETSCDETAAAIYDGTQIIASEVASQIDIHRPHGGVVPEIASRNHLIALQPVVESALGEAVVTLGEMSAFAATAGPGLASSLLVGNTAAKSFALALNKPFLAVNHLEGHLLSSYMGLAEGVTPSIGLVISGGHTMLVEILGAGEYRLMGTTRDDAAGEAYDKVAKMLGLPYPGGPEIDNLAKKGTGNAFDFPRSMMQGDSLEFSFSGLKTAVLYQIQKLNAAQKEHWLPDICASFQEAVIDVLIEKSIRACRQVGIETLSLSGGVSCNSRLRSVFSRRCEVEGVQLLLADRALCTDNAAMIAYAASARYEQGLSDSLETDVNPNMKLRNWGEI